MVTLILILLAIVCFLLATFNAPVRINLIALGLTLWAATLLVGQIGTR